ncbi:DUF4097 family beta strand repeat-containing protein [Flexithrix dorotheae]|uniref:DUF4097 family beta strand repeat-containing protein n=1 Tax=Flexithrix dorotheae TaxID=70993 RepID=UPI0003796D67|nr:DUF4097 family beta strand repeat-containing protein [Flexithrix dorotheae]
MNKIAKIFFTLLLAIGMAVGLHAQEFKTKFTGKSSNSKISIALNNSEVIIEGHEGNDVIIIAKGFKAPPKRAEGLKPLYNTNVDNTGIGLALIIEGDEMKIEKASREDIDYTFKIPSNVRLVVNETQWQGDGIEVHKMAGEVEVNAKNSDIVFKDVTGPIVANTTNGDIEIVYLSLNQEKPNSIKSVNGFVDVTLPASSKAEVKMRSMNGEIYSNFELTYPEDKKGIPHVGGNNTIEGKLNGGGIMLSINSINDDIYLRKK